MTITDITTATTAVLAVDAQQGFMPGTAPGYGELPAPDGDLIAAPLAALAPLGRVFAASADQHPADHCSFQAAGGPWPAHCVAGTPGADLHPLVAAQVTGGWLFAKGTTVDTDSYSAFDAADPDGMLLGDRLRADGIDTVIVGGLVTNVCVLETVMDGLAEGFRVIVARDAVRGIPGGEDLLSPEQALGRMAAAGADVRDLAAAAA